MCQSQLPFKYYATTDFVSTMNEDHAPKLRDDYLLRDDDGESHGKDLYLYWSDMAQDVIMWDESRN